MKYPIFSFDNFDYHYENDSLIINFYYSCSQYSFIHKLKINSLNVQMPNDQIDKYIFNIGMSLIPSYWKLFCSPTIQIADSRFQITDNQIKFWEKLLIKGMGEYFYKNQIDFTKKDFLKIICAEAMQTGAQEVPPEGKATEHQELHASNKVLIPVGGGKDSIVTLELLKKHFEVTAFVTNPVPLINEVIQVANVPVITIENIFDPELFELNKQGFLNGHVPISAFYAFCSLLTAHLLDIPYVAFSNERSSSEGNTVYLGHEINHQYSKTLEFETDLNEYITKLNAKCEMPNVKYFSFLRPLYELQISKIFSHYPQYFNIFSSCNNNFKLNKNNNNLWCCNCPKCVSTSLMLSQFIGKDKVVEIMGNYPPNMPSNFVTIDQLTGKSLIKPFECVLTRNEALACTTGQNINEILSSWQDNPNMPEEFTNILKSNL